MTVAVPRLLRGLSPEDQRVVLAACERAEHAPGAFVFHQDSGAETLHMVLDGRYAVRSTAADGTGRMIAVLGPGDAFGEVGLLREGQRRSAAVSALEHGVTLALSRKSFLGLCRSRPQVRDLIEQQLADQVDRLTTLLSEALWTDVDTRVVRRLGEVVGTYALAPGIPVTVALTQDELAQLAGTSRATANRVLRDLERDAVVELGRGKVHVLAPERLPDA